MNKTVHANIGGLIFHIDEDAYQKLHQYLDRLRTYFRQTDTSSDILEDIEARIAELLQDRLGDKRQIVNNSDVDAVIQAMGKPEDFDDVAGEGPTAGRTESTAHSFGRRLFRNPDDKQVGGVASGLAAYFNIDVIWLRLMFILFIFFWGTGVLIYIILWVIVPEATTPSEKLQMRGEPVTVSNIEKSVREELEQVGERIKGFAKSNFNTDGAGGQPSSVSRAANKVGEVLSVVLQTVGKLFGVFIIIVGMIMLGSLLVALFTTSTAFSVSLPFVNEFLFSSTSQALWMSTGVLMLTIVPIAWFIVTIILALMKVKQGRRFVHLGFLAVFLAGLFITIGAGINLGLDFRSKGVVKEEMTIDQPVSDTLTLSMNEPDWPATGDIAHVYAGDDYIRIGMGDFDITEDTLYYTDIEIRTVATRDSIYSLTMYYYARGNTALEGRERARDISYSFSQAGDRLMFDPLFQAGDHPYRNQHIRIIVRVPEGKQAIVDPALEEWTNRHIYQDY